MSVSNDSTLRGTIDDSRALLSSAFLEFCAKVRNDDPSILPQLGKPFKIRRLSEREGLELADALLENNSITYLELMKTDYYTKSSAQAMAKYVRTRNRLQRIHWCRYARTSEERKKMFCCFLPAIQESTSLKELHMKLPAIGGPSSLAFENMLKHTQSLRSLILFYPEGLQEDIAVAAAQSGLKKNTTLRELTLEFSRGAMNASPILNSLRDHPLQRLCLRGPGVDLDGLEAVLLSDTSKINELEIEMCLPIKGLSRVLHALARRPTLTKLRLHGCPLGHDGVRLLRVALCNIPRLQSLLLTSGTLGSASLHQRCTTTHPSKC
jgi:hypothetical protein